MLSTQFFSKMSTAIWFETPTLLQRIFPCKLITKELIERLPFRSLRYSLITPKKSIKNLKYGLFYYDKSVMQNIRR